MAAVIVSDYFYGDESKEFSYFRIPRLLITHQRFKNVSVEAKLLYGLLLDRMGLSEEHGWYDEDGRVFIYYTVEEISDDLCCGRDKAMKLLAELDKATCVWRFSMVVYLRHPLRLRPSLVMISVRSVWMSPCSSSAATYFATVLTEMPSFFAMVG